MQNFGKINETFKDILIDSIISKGKKGKKIFNSYVKALKENKTLATQYEIYNLIESKSITDRLKSSDFLSEAISILKGLGKDKIISENGKLIKYLTKKGYKFTTNDYINKELHENIEILIMKEKTVKNLNKILESKSFIKDRLNSNVELVNEGKIETFPNSVVGPIMVEKFNSKYDNLTEIEKLVIESVIKGSEVEREELYTNTILECVDLVNEQLSECSIDEKDKLLQVKDKLLRFKYNEDNYITEISNIVGLKGNLIK